MSIASSSRVKPKGTTPCLHDVDLHTLICKHCKALVYQPQQMHVIVAQLQYEAVFQQQGQDIVVQTFHKTLATTQEKVSNWQSATLKEVYGMVHTAKQSLSVMIEEKKRNLRSFEEVEYT